MSLWHKRSGVRNITNLIWDLEWTTLSGHTNPLALMTVREGRFICSFDNVDNFPFGDQVCGFKFWIMGTDNLLTQLRLDSLTYLGCQSGKEPFHLDS